MKLKRSLIAVGLISLSGFVGAADEHAGHGAHWGYKGDMGPDRWTSLKPEFSACAGKNQSPIDVSGTIDAKLKPVRFSYKAGGHEVVNNGHTIQVNIEDGSSIVVDGIQFNLKQFHFHSPSENHISGKSYPLEAHLVHADKDRNLAVVAVVFNEGCAAQLTFRYQSRLLSLQRFPDDPSWIVRNHDFKTNSTIGLAFLEYRTVIITCRQFCQRLHAPYLMAISTDRPLIDRGGLKRTLTSLCSCQRLEQ